MQWYANCTFWELLRLKKVSILFLTFYAITKLLFVFVLFQSPRLMRKERLCKKVSDTSTCSLPNSRITSLILVIHGGTQIDTGLDPTSRDMDFKLLQDAFEAVVNSHYRGAVGKIALRLVECPAICSKALNLLSQLCPYSESDSGKNWEGIVTAPFCMSRTAEMLKIQDAVFWTRRILPSWKRVKTYNWPLQKLREDWALAFDARISGIVWVIFASYNWLTVTLETMNQL